MQSIEVFNERQRNILKGKMWWVADQERPFLIKFALDNTDSLMQITDLRNVWSKVFTLDFLIQQKKKFAKSLQLKADRDLILLFETLFAGSDLDAKYVFNELTGTDINFTFSKRISIFDFSWNFKLPKVSSGPLDLICRQIINPLAAALEAQTKRNQQLKVKFQQIQKEYVRNMRQTQKPLYKSPLLQQKQDLKQLLPKNDGKLLSYINLDESNKFLCGAFLKKQQKVKKQQKRQQFIGRGQKRVPKLKQAESFDSFQDLNRSLQVQRSLKKKKQIDFI